MLTGSLNTRDVDRLLSSNRRGSALLITGSHDQTRLKRDQKVLYEDCYRNNCILAEHTHFWAERRYLRLQVSKVERMRGEVVGEHLNTAPAIFGSVNVACRHKPSEVLAARLLNILASHGYPTTRRAAEMHHGMSRANALLGCEESHNQERSLGK
jgi:hypothetical protein